MHECVRGELFSRSIAADSRRKEFDIKNETLIHCGVKPEFVFIGDSITHYWEINAFFDTDRHLMINRGIGGDITEYVKKRFYVDVIQLKPAYCILGIGTNDTKEMAPDFWSSPTVRTYDEIVASVKADYRDIIRQAKAGNVNLILTSILPRHKPGSINEDIKMQYICTINQWMETEAEKEQLIFVNYFDALIDHTTNQLKAGVTVDGLHPNGRGYAVMANVLKDTLERKGVCLG